MLSGVGGTEALGSSPKRARCVGVRGISVRSSFGRKSGYKAMRILAAKYIFSRKYGIPTKNG